MAFLKLYVLLNAALCVWPASAFDGQSTEGDLFRSGYVRRWTAASLQHQVIESNKCTFALVGATWDGHFKRMVNEGYWQRLAEVMAGDERVVVGAMLYTGASAGPEALPWLANSSSGRRIWESSPGSYDIQVFGAGGELIENAAIDRHSWVYWRGGSNYSAEVLALNAYSSCMIEPKLH